MTFSKFHKFAIANAKTEKDRLFFSTKIGAASLFIGGILQRVRGRMCPDRETILLNKAIKQLSVLKRRLEEETAQRSVAFNIPLSAGAKP